LILTRRAPLAACGRRRAGHCPPPSTAWPAQFGPTLRTSKQTRGPSDGQALGVKRLYAHQRHGPGANASDARRHRRRRYHLGGWQIRSTRMPRLSRDAKGGFWDSSRGVAVREVTVAFSWQSVDQLNDGAGSSRRLRRLHGLFVLGVGGAIQGWCATVWQTQVCGLRRVRVRGKHLHRARARFLTWAFMFLRCASPVFRRCGRVADRIPLARHERPSARTCR
jgi:hypothetical protein